MPNTQPAEPIDNNRMLEFIYAWETIQGEGPFVGRPAVFVRLAGCNLQCSFCDTDYTTGRRGLTAHEIVVIVQDIRSAPSLVVLTGGEPMRQDITELVCGLLAVGYEVQIETNGTVYRELPWDRWKLTVVCSPKGPPVDRRLVAHVDAWKFVVGDGVYDHGTDIQALATQRTKSGELVPISLKWGTVYVQPRDDGEQHANAHHLQEAINVALRYDYRLSLQTHKIIGVE